MGIFNFFKNKEKTPDELRPIFDRMKRHMDGHKMADEAISYRNLGDYDKALQLLEVALRDYEYKPAISLIGNTKLLQGDINGAILWFTDHITTVSSDEYPILEFYANLGSICNKYLNQYSRAIKFYEKALEMPRPYNISEDNYRIMVSMVHHDMAIIYENLGELSLAHEYAKRRLAVEPACLDCKEMIARFGDSKPKLSAQEKNPVDSSATRIERSHPREPHHARVEGAETYAKGDYARAYKELKPLAEKGNAGAQVYLGAMYVKGQGVPLDYTMAMKWFLKAAEQGSPEAQFNLGIMYEKGNGVPKALAEALTWFRKAAGQGHPSAQFRMGAMYNFGEGVSKDYVEAAKWFRKAAENGHGDGQLALGLMYRDGAGVSRDYVEAVKWYRMAAERGIAAAELDLGAMYYQGHGVAQDYTIAAKWVRKAAEQGYAPAQGFLGGMYLKGYGVPQDYVQAYMWFDLVAEQGMSRGAENREDVAKKMTASQIAEARRLAMEWKPKGKD